VVSARGMGLTELVLALRASIATLNCTSLQRHTGIRTRAVILVRMPVNPAMG
jgi:hypothetical protein